MKISSAWIFASLLFWKAASPIWAQEPPPPNEPAKLAGFLPKQNETILNCRPHDTAGSRRSRSRRKFPRCQIRNSFCST